MSTVRAPRTDAAPDTLVTRVRAHVRDALKALPPAEHTAPLLVAVSGGRDSVALLDALLAVAAARVVGVATFDHGTGEPARAAARHAVALAGAVGVRVWAGRAPADMPATEVAWRTARWRFLRSAAREAGVAGVSALIAPGHTRDDQLETVLMRALRGAGARGLAGMRLHGAGVVRPLLGVARADVAAYAHARGLGWVDDPGNRSRAHLRNRVRLDLLPRAAAVRPGLGDEVLQLAKCAAGWRAAVDDAAAALGGPRAATSQVRVPLAVLAAYDDAALRLVWPALAARAGVTLDRRGIARLATFTTRCTARPAARAEPRGAVPLAAGATARVERIVGGRGAPSEWEMVLSGEDGERSGERATAPAPAALGGNPADGSVTFGAWRFIGAADDLPSGADDPWRVRLPADCRYVVRAWRPGDRMPYRADGAARRVKRYLADRRVPATERVGWPVVVAVPVGASLGVGSIDVERGEIVWIPGVRRSPAAPVRPGEPGLVLHCERT